eukprot:Opistho-1_new@105592
MRGVGARRACAALRGARVHRHRRGVRTERHLWGHRRSASAIQVPCVDSGHHGLCHALPARLHILAEVRALDRQETVEKACRLLHHGGRLPVHDYRTARVRGGRVGVVRFHAPHYEHVHLHAALLLDGGRRGRHPRRALRPVRPLRRARAKHRGVSSHSPHQRIPHDGLVPVRPTAPTPMAFAKERGRAAENARAGKRADGGAPPSTAPRARHRQTQVRPRATRDDAANSVGDRVLRRSRGLGRSHRRARPRRRRLRPKRPLHAVRRRRRVAQDREDQDNWPRVHGRRQRAERAGRPHVPRGTVRSHSPPPFCRRALRCDGRREEAVD